LLSCEQVPRILKKSFVVVNLLDVFDAWPDVDVVCWSSSVGKAVDTDVCVPGNSKRDEEIHKDRIQAQVARLVDSSG
jgi:hypothetical protein